MATTFIKIASVTVGSGGASSISFSSIPATYTDLVLKVSARTDSSGTSKEFRVNFNSDTGANYDWIRIYGDGGAAVSQKGSTIGAPYTSFVLAGGANGSTTTSSTFANNEIYVPNYANTSAYKSTSSESAVENNATDAYVLLTAGIWKSNSAISSVQITTNSGNFVQYSTATLYGIKNS
jgi:hypothetical protein